MLVNTGSITWVGFASPAGGQMETYRSAMADACSLRRPTRRGVLTGLAGECPAGRVIKSWYD